MRCSLLCGGAFLFFVTPNTLYSGTCFRFQTFSFKVEISRTVMEQAEKVFTEHPLKTKVLKSNIIDR